MEFSAKQIADYLNGDVVGDENALVSTFSKIEEGVRGSISFLANPKYNQYIYDTAASIVLVNRDFTPEKEIRTTLIMVDNAYESLSKLLALYQSTKKQKQGISKLSFVAESATVGENAYVGEFAYIGENCVIGKNVKIYPNAVIYDGSTIGDNCTINSNVTIYHDTKIGNRCVIHSGAVVGADGFGFAPTPDGYNKIEQIGVVIVEDDVEIGANTCIDRATMGATVIRKGVKLDNLIQVAHNDEIGEHTVIAAQTGIAGSTKIGRWCMFGGQVGVAGHITVGDKVNLGAQAGVPSSIKDNSTMMGTPVMDVNNFFKSSVIVKKLPELYMQINKMSKEIEELKKQINK